MKTVFLNLILGISVTLTSTLAEAQGDPFMFMIDVDLGICTILDADGQPADVACNIQSFRFSRRVFNNVVRANVSAAARFDTGADDGSFSFFRCSNEGTTCIIVFNGDEYSTPSCSEFLSGLSSSGRLSCNNATPLP